MPTHEIVCPAHGPVVNTAARDVDDEVNWYCTRCSEKCEVRAVKL